MNGVDGNGLNLELKLSRCVLSYGFAFPVIIHLLVLQKHFVYDYKGIK